MKRKQNKSRFKKRPDIIFANIVIGGLILFTIAILLWGFGAVIYRDAGKPTDADKERAIAQLQNSVRQIQLQGEPIYDVTRDEGCLKSDQGYHGYSIVCTAAAYVYYKNNGSVEEDIEKVVLQLENIGWKRSQYSSFGFEMDNAGLALRAYPENDHAGTIPQELLRQEKASLEESEYIYGMSLSSKYWSCSNTIADFWKYPCPEVETE